MIAIKETPFLNEIKQKHFRAVKSVLTESHKRWIDDLMEREFGRKLESLICGNYQTLRMIFDRWKDHGPGGYNKPWPDYIMALNDLYETFGSTKNNIGPEKYNVVELVEATGLKVCPYCDRSFISFYKNGSHRLRTCQIDHFWPKQDYPYLAMSFHNLIPSCHNCNHKKSTKLIDISPYDTNVDPLREIWFEFNTRSGSPEPKDEKDLLIAVKHSPDGEKNVQKFELEQLYRLHSDVAFDSYIARKTNPKSRIEELRSNFPSIFKTKHHVIRTILGNFYREQDLGKRPLSRLTMELYDTLLKDLL